MGLIVGGSGVPSGETIFEAIWDLNGPQSALGAGVANIPWLPRGAGPLFTSAPQQAGGGSGIQINAVPNSQKVAWMISGAAVASIQATALAAAGPFTVPLARNPAFSKLWPRCEYLFECIIAVGAARGTADVHVGFMENPAVMPAQAGVGIFWSSRTGANGGRWTPRSKRTNGGADFVDGPDSGIAYDLVQRKLGIRFLDTVAPTVDFAIDDRSIFAMGIPNLPTLIPNAGGTTFQPMISFGPPAGTDCWLTAMRYRVRSL